MAILNGSRIGRDCVMGEGGGGGGGGGGGYSPHVPPGLQRHEAFR